jgi:hypothetical protein
MRADMGYRTRLTCTRKPLRAMHRRLPSNTRYWRRFAAVLVLVAFAVRALVPVGFMPDPRAAIAGSLEFVICTPSGLKTVTLRLEPQPQPDASSQLPVAPADHRVGEPCAFIGLALGIETTTGTLDRWAGARLVEIQFAAVSRPAAERRVKANGARGPPTSS